MKAKRVSAQVSPWNVRLGKPLGVESDYTPPPRARSRLEAALIRARCVKA